MKSKLLNRASVTATILSVTWVFSLAALVVRTKLAAETFPALAKFTPFRNHLAFTDWMLSAFPVLAFVALLCIAGSYWSERNIRSVRALGFTFAASLALSMFTILANPGGYFCWFLS